MSGESGTDFDGSYFEGVAVWRLQGVRAFKSQT